MRRRGRGQDSPDEDHEHHGNRALPWSRSRRRRTTARDAGTRVHWEGRRSRTTPKRPTPMLEYVIVEIETDEGVRGFGEGQADIGFFGETVEQVQIGVEDYLGPQLARQGPARARAPARADRPSRQHVRPLGHRHGVARSRRQASSAHRSGRCSAGRTGATIEVAVEIAGGAPAAMAAECVSFMERGVRVFKPKIGGMPGGRRRAAARDPRGGRAGRRHPGRREPGIHAEGGDPALPARRARRRRARPARTAGRGLEPRGDGGGPARRRHADRGRRELLLDPRRDADRAPRGRRRPQHQARQGGWSRRREEDRRDRRGCGPPLRPRDSVRPRARDRLEAPARRLDADRRRRGRVHRDRAARPRCSSRPTTVCSRCRSRVAACRCRTGPGLGVTLDDRRRAQFRL